LSPSRTDLSAPGGKRGPCLDVVGGCPPVLLWWHSLGVSPMQKELNAIESGFDQTGETEQGVLMTETEKILTQAEDIARRTFEEPTQQTVMQLFVRLC